MKKTRKVGIKGGMKDLKSQWSLTKSSNSFLFFIFAKQRFASVSRPKSQQKPHQPPHHPPPLNHTPRHTKHNPFSFFPLLFPLFLWKFQESKQKNAKSPFNIYRSPPTGKSPPLFFPPLQPPLPLETPPDHRPPPPFRFSPIPPFFGTPG